MKQTTIPKGTLFYFSSGEYSGYCVQFIAKALKDINPDDLKAEYLAKYPEQNDAPGKQRLFNSPYNFKCDVFIKWLFDNNYFEEIPSREFHLYDYGRISEMYVTDDELTWRKEK